MKVIKHIKIVIYHCYWCQDLQGYLSRKLVKEGCSQVRWRCTQTRRHLADHTAFSAWRSSTRFGTVATVHNFVPRCNGCFNGRFVESIIVNDDGEEHVVLKYINFVVKLCFVVIGSFSCFLPNSIYMIQDGFNVSFFRNKVLHISTLWHHCFRFGTFLNNRPQQKNVFAVFHRRTSSVGQSGGSGRLGTAEEIADQRQPFEGRSAAARLLDPFTLPNNQLRCIYKTS